MTILCRKNLSLEVSSISFQSRKTRFKPKTVEKEQAEMWKAKKPRHKINNEANSASI